MDVSAIVDNQAESSLIATLVYHPDFILHSDFLKPSYFYNVENGCIYWCIQELYKNGVDTIDAINITNIINSNSAIKKKLKEYNIPDMQTFISMSRYAARHTLEEYKLLVNIVVSLSFKRELVRATDEIQKSCFNLDMSLGDLNQLVNKKLNKLTEKYITGEEIKLLGEQIDSIWERIDNEDITDRLPSKFPSFNNYFYYEPGELVLLTARFKSGKSVFLLQEALDKVKAGVPTLYIDREMSTESFTKRAICCLTGIPFRTIQNKTYNNEEKKLIQKAIEWIRKAPLCHLYMPSATIDEIYSICKILKTKIGLRFFVYDYIKNYNSDAYANSALLGQMADGLKNKIAGELDLAVLTAAQLARNDMIANSDNIARAISTGIYWRFKTSEEIAEHGGLDAGNALAYININRNGNQTDESEAIYFDFDGDHIRISEAKKQRDSIPDTPFGE